MSERSVSSESSLRKTTIRFLLCAGFAVVGGALSACSTVGSQILDKEKGWIQINHGSHIDVYFCDATQKWPTCKVPEYVRTAD